MTKKIEFPSVLAFERKINPSDAYFYGTQWENRAKEVPLSLAEKSVRGTISNRLSSSVAGDPLKLNNSIETANLQRIDYCALPEECDTLKIVFTVKILGNIGLPSSCNRPEFNNSLQQSVERYRSTYGFRELARRYAANIANGRFLWRNRVGAENIEIHVSQLGGDSNWLCDGKKYSTRHFDEIDDQIDNLGSLIAKVLCGNHSITLKVVAYAKLGSGQEVYPSQEMILDRPSTDKKSKVLYSVNNVAALHSQKIGNALRTIDTWYPEYSDPINGVGPIAAEPYGAVTSMGKAFRNNKDKVDFYSLFDKFACGEILESETDQHYVMAVLIRGGVFGKGDK